MEKKKNKKVVKKVKKGVIKGNNIVFTPVFENDEDNKKSENHFSLLRIFFTAIILLVFFSSAIVVFFNTKEDREKVVFNELKKHISQRLKKEGPSVEIYKTIAEIYKNQNQDLYYLYLKEALSWVKESEIPESREIIKNLLEIAYQKNEKIENILHYLILLYKATKPSNPEFFQILASITEIYNSMENFEISEKILKNLEQIYQRNLQIKYLLAHHYYITNKLNLAKTKIDYVINFKKTSKQPYNLNEVSLFYDIYSKLESQEQVIEKVVPLTLSLSSQELNSFLMFLIAKPFVNMQNYKKFVASISLYRPETKILVNTNPYINLELGRKCWNNSQKSLAEIYFSNALKNSNQEIKKLIQDEIYQIKKQSASLSEDKSLSKENGSSNKKDSQKTIDTKKILENIR